MGSALVCVELGVGPNGSNLICNKFGGVEKKNYFARSSLPLTTPQSARSSSCKSQVYVLTRVRAPPPVSRKYMYERAGGVGARIRVVSGTHSQ